MTYELHFLHQKYIIRQAQGWALLESTPTISLVWVGSKASTYLISFTILYFDYKKNWNFGLKVKSLLTCMNFIRKLLIGVKNVGPKKYLVWNKILVWKKKFGPKFFFVNKKIWVKKIVIQKILVQKNFWSKKRNLVWKTP